MRAKVHIEVLPNDRKNLVITELPYQVNKADLLTKILALREDKKDLLAGIAEIVDESDKEGVRAVVRIKRITTRKNSGYTFQAHKPSMHLRNKHGGNRGRQAAADGVA